jgi:hypothetical protein
MSERARRRAFVLAAAALAAAAGLVIAGSGRERTRPAERAVTAAASTSGIARAPGRPARSLDTRWQASDRRNTRHASRPRRSLDAARRQARRFLGGFLGYESGRINARARHALAMASTPGVVHYLLAQRARQAQCQRASARLVRLDVYGPSRGRVKVSATLGYRGISERSLFEFALEPRERSWRVVELYP